MRARPWNQGQGPWGAGEEWEYVSDPLKHVIDTEGEVNHQPKGTRMIQEEVDAKNRELSQMRSSEVKSKTTTPAQWSSYPQTSIDGPSSPETKKI